MNTVIAGKAGIFGSMRERQAQRAAAPYAVYTIQEGLFWVTSHETAESARGHGKAFAEYKGWEFQDRTGEEA